MSGRRSWQQSTALGSAPPTCSKPPRVAPTATATNPDRARSPMGAVIEARGLSKSFGKFHALDNVSFSAAAGRIVGLIGPNGAGKTTALRAILGLTNYEGELKVLDLDPYTQRDRLMQEVCFIADVAVLPGWLRVQQAVDFVAGVHPRFRPELAEQFLGRTNIKRTSRVRELSKGMITQLHLALVMAIDAKLLVLDEPTIGLDIIYRKQFYESLLSDYFDHERTIVITTHQVEEVENLLTDVLFIDRGRIVLDSTMEQVAESFVQLTVNPDHVAAAREFKPFYEREVFGRTVMFFQNAAADALHKLGDARTPSVADLFVAKIKGAAA